jgi:hypothetical protein
MTMQSYLLRACTAALAVIGIIAGLGIAVDPFGIFGTRIVPHSLFPHDRNFRSGADRTRKSLELAARRQPIDLLIVGSSRSFLGFDPASPVLRPLNAYNGGLGAGGLEEAVRMVHFALAKHPEIGRILWGIDSDRFLAGATDNPEVSDSPLTGMPLASGKLRQLLASEPVSILFRAIGAMATGKLRPDVQSDGRDVTEARDHGAAQRAATFAAQLAFYCRQLALSGANAPELDLAPLTGTLKALKRRGVDVDLVIYPLHLRVLAALDLAGALDHLDAFKRRISAAVDAARDEPGPGRIRLFDFNRVNPATAEAVPPPGASQDMRYFFESSHFTPRLGDAIVSALGQPAQVGGGAELGVVLEPANLEARLAQNRAAFLAWRDQNPAEIQAVGEAGCGR